MVSSLLLKPIWFRRTDDGRILTVDCQWLSSKDYGIPLFALFFGVEMSPIMRETLVMVLVQGGRDTKYAFNFILIF